MSSSWLSRREVDKQYRPKGYGLSPGLLRARAPFRTRNAITGIAIGAFVVGVWAYSISAVKQDTFEDLDEEARELLAARVKDERIAVGAGAGAGVSGVSGVVSPSSDLGAVESASAKLVDSRGAQTLSATGPTGSPPTHGSIHSRTQGVLASQLHQRFPRVLDPESRTLVWGAPPVDRIGRLGDKNDRPS